MYFDRSTCIKVLYETGLDMMPYSHILATCRNFPWIASFLGNTTYGTILEKIDMKKLGAKRYNSITRTDQRILFTES